MLARPHRSRSEGAGERTDLAWNRSGIAVLICVAALLRRVWGLGRSDHIVALILVGAGAGTWSVGLVVARGISRTTHRGRHVMGSDALRLVSLGTLVLAAGGFVLGLFPPS